MCPASTIKSWRPLPAFSPNCRISAPSPPIASCKPFEPWWKSAHSNNGPTKTKLILPFLSWSITLAKLEKDTEQTHLPTQSQKNDPLLGRLFFANRDASGGRVMPLPTDPNAILEWLDDEGLGDCPIVTVYRKSKEMVTRRAGTSNSARSDPIRDHEPSATLPELLEALQHFHRNGC